MLYLYIVYVAKKLLHCILTISLVCVPYILLLYCKLCKVSIWLKYSLKLCLHVVCQTCQNNLRPLMPIVELSTAIVSSFPQGRKVTEEIHFFSMYVHAWTNLAFECSILWQSGTCFVLGPGVWSIIKINSENKLSFTLMTCLPKLRTNNYKNDLYLT